MRLRLSSVMVCFLSSVSLVVIAVFHTQLTAGELNEHPSDPKASLGNERPTQSTRPSTSPADQPLKMAWERTYIKGSLSVPENHDDPAGKQITLHYETSDPILPDQEQIVCIQGGPGFCLRGIQSSVDNHLAGTVKTNYFFFDPRGVGQSSEITKPDDPSLKNYHTSDVVQDLEYLRKHVIKQKEVTLMGYSYGGFLAYRYAAKFPEHVKQLIILNGPLTGYGFAYQPYIQRRFVYDHILDGIDESDFVAAALLSFNDEIFPLKGAKVPLMPIFLLGPVLDVSQTAYNQRHDHDSIKRIIEVNRDKIEEFKKAHPALPSLDWLIENLLEGAPLEARKMQGLNDAINKFIICNEILQPELMDNMNSDAKILALRERNRLCNDVISDPRPNSIPAQVENLARFPILITAGQNDPNISSGSLKVEFEQLSAFNKRVSFVEFDFCGHDPFQESDSLPDIISQFLRGELKPGIIDKKSN